MTSRIPSAARFHALPTLNQMEVIEGARRQIDDEIQGLRTGYIFLTDGQSRTHHLRLLHARRRRLATLAAEVGLGYLTDEQMVAA